MIDSKNGIIGLVVGDAMGVPVEFQSRDYLTKNPVVKMMGNGTYNVPLGTWSDDSSMTLATTSSIINKKTIDYNDIALNFIKWMDEAAFTATDLTFDIGRTCFCAINNYKRNRGKIDSYECGMSDEYSNGNGSLMRILPIAYYAHYKNLCLDEIYEVTKKTSSITHKHDISVMGCFIYVLFSIELLKGENLTDAYKSIKKVDYSKYFSSRVIDKYHRILNNDISKYNINEIKSTGFVIDTLEAALWSLFTTDSYDSCILKAVNLGSDTDTVGAVSGGLAGIYYGYNTINKEWLKGIIRLDYIINICKEFDKVLSE